MIEENMNHPTTACSRIAHPRGEAGSQTGRSGVSHFQMQIPYTATNFPATSAANLIGTHTLTTSWVDVVWSAITAGKPGASHLLAHRWHSLADIVVRTHTIYANLYQCGQYFNRSPLYESLDPTEKGANSYFLGMAMAKLFAAELFDTPWLFHVSQASIGGATIAFKRGSKSQPDLIGRKTTGDWIVVEAKGRTNGLDTNALSKAKLQTSMIRTVNGIPPSLRVALQVYFDDRMTVRMDVPADSAPEELEVKLDLDAAFACYYSMAQAITAKASTSEFIFDREFVTCVDEESGVTIGLQSSILESVSAGKFEAVRVDRSTLIDRVTKVDENTSVYPDGLFVRLDARWSSQLMTRQPEARDG